jgi:hypothetical protein
MELNWWILGLVAFCVLMILVYLIWKNWKDEKEVVKSLNEEEIIPEKHEPDDEVI